MQLWFWAPAGYGVRFHPTAHKTSPDPSARWGILLPSTHQTLRFNTAGHLEMFLRQNSCHVSSKLSHEEQKPCLNSKSKTPVAVKNAIKASGVKIPSWVTEKTHFDNSYCLAVHHHGPRRADLWFCFCWISEESETNACKVMWHCRRSAKVVRLTNAEVFFLNDTFSPGLLWAGNATGNFVSAKNDTWNSNWGGSWKLFFTFNI